MIIHTRALALCFLGAVFCVNGFILGCSPSMHHICFHDRRKRPFMLMQNEQDTKDESNNMMYPEETLFNIGANSTQTLIPNIAYFYLRNTVGLSEEAMWKVTLESCSILGMTPRNLEKKVSLLRRTMNLSDEDVRVILGKAPTLLHYSADRNLAPTILFLVRSLDLSKGELRTMVMNCPTILSYSLGNLSKKIAFFVALGYDADGEGGIDCIRELLVGTPRLLLTAVDTGLVPRLKFLTQEINFSVEEVWRMVRSNPKLLLHSLDDNLREKIVFFFILQLHMEPEDVRRILLAYPQIMDYNLENHMKPIAEYFMAELEFSAAELGSIILKFPRLFSYSLFRIKHFTLGFLRYELELDSRQAKRVIFQAPQVLGLAEGTMRAKLDFLRNRLELSIGELGLVLSKMPTLMCLGIKKLASKLDFLESSLNHPDNKLLKDTVLTQPSLLGYSLHLRIQPRMEQLKAAGIQPHKITVGISMSEARFQQWLSSSQSKRMTKSIVTKRNSTASGVLHRELNLNEDELNLIYSELPDINDWTVSSIGSWITYLKEELNVSVDELKDTVLSHPHLLDGSSRPKLKPRLKLLGSVCPVLDNLDTLCLSDDDFQGWIGRKKKEFGSKLSYLTRKLGLNDTESRSLLSKMPSLVTAQANKIFQHRLEYLFANFSTSMEDVKLLILGHPSLLDLPMKRTIEPRMQRLRLAGVLDTPYTAAMLTMSDNDYRAYLSLNLLQSVLNLTQQDAEYLLLNTRHLLLRDPEDSLLPKLNYLLQVFDGCKTRAATCVLANPALLDFPLDDWIMPRMKLVLDAGLDPSEINDIVSLSPREVNQRVELQTNLNLTNAELNRLLPMKDWLAQRSFKGNAETIIQYLRSLGLSIVDVKKTLLREPKLLTLPLSRTIQARMELLLESGCPPTDIGKTVLLSQRKVDEHCSKCYLCARLGFSSNQISSLFSTIQSKKKQSLLELREIVEYLLHNVFGDSELMLKAAIIQDPTILKQSLYLTVRPRAVAMQYLTSIGLGHKPIDIAGFFTQSDSSITKELVPQMKTWYPKVSDVLDGSFGGKYTNNTTQEKNRIHATLKDFPQSLALAYSDDPNREAAAIVHWR
jgi:mTERF domain-containing protein